MFRNRCEWLLYNADKGGAGGDAGGAGGGNDEENAGAVAFQQALSRHQNNVEGLARQLFDDNYNLRQQNRTLRGQTAPTGSVILAGDDLTLWNAYKALGKPTDLVLASTVTTAKTDLATAQSALATAQAEVATLKRGQLLREVADAAGMVYGVLATLDKPDLAYQIVDGKDKDNKPTKQVKVKAGDKEHDLDAYAQANWGAFMPALRPTQASSGTPFVAQAGGGGKQQPPQNAASAAGNYLAQRYGTPQKKS